MRILVSPDKFKGTLDARAAARAIARGWKAVRPEDVLELLPMSDGGDGFGEVLGSILGARARSTSTTDAAGRTRRAKWWWIEDRQLAILEAAQSNGLALLPKGRFHPFELDTAGVAKLVLAALRRGATECIVGVGGSATNDGGFGMARALGWRFFDKREHPIEEWTALARLHRIERPVDFDPRCRFVVAADVENPLAGPGGATRVYGPQKGLRSAELSAADAALRRLGTVAGRLTDVDPAITGCGAAGGLGFGLRAFLGAERKSGFQVFSDAARLPERIRGVDIVLTGEGSFDRQSVMGKGVGQWIQLCARHGKRLGVLAGRVDLGRITLPREVTWAGGLTDLTDATTAMAETALWLERLAGEAAKAIANRHS